MNKASRQSLTIASASAYRKKQLAAAIAKDLSVLDKLVFVLFVVVCLPLVIVGLLICPGLTIVNLHIGLIYIGKHLYPEHLPSFLTLASLINTINQAKKVQRANTSLNNQRR